jgi:hypothetical protein
VPCHGRGFVTGAVASASFFSSGWNKRRLVKLRARSIPAAARVTRHAAWQAHRDQDERDEADVEAPWTCGGRQANVRSATDTRG